MQIVRTASDLAKYVFEVRGVEDLLRKTLRQDAVASFFAELPACIVGIDAYSGARDALPTQAGSGSSVVQRRATRIDRR